MMDEMTYKGVTVVPRYNSEDKKFEATILLEKGRAFFNAASVSELERHFRECVDELEADGLLHLRRRPLRERLARMLQAS